MAKATPFKTNEAGRYETAGLSESDFVRVFNAIKQDQIKNRQSAKNTLQPKRLSRKSVEDLVKIGRKEDGTAFTEADLKRFAKMRDKYRSRRSGEKGILYAELIANARQIDIKRASGSSGDGLEIRNARFAKLEQGNVAVYRVKASNKSKHQEHRVRVRLESWEQEMEQADGENYKLAVKRAVRGHYSIDCSCGRHQYWYRYMATVGGYLLGRPRELSFPKVRNPNLVGTACKHVLLTAKKLQNASEHARLAVQMEKQAIQVGYTDSGKGSTYTARKNEKVNERGSQITERQQEQAKAEFAKYQARKGALNRKVKENPAAIKKQQQEIKRLKSQVSKQQRKEQQLQKQVNALKAKQQQNIKNKLKSQVEAAIGVAVGFGATRQQAIDSYAKQSGISKQAIEKALK